MSSVGEPPRPSVPRTGVPTCSPSAASWSSGCPTASAGGSGISALIGLLIGTAGLAVLGPSLTTLAILVVATELILTRLAPVTR